MRVLQLLILTTILSFNTAQAQMFNDDNWYAYMESVDGSEIAFQNVLDIRKKYNDKIIELIQNNPGEYFSVSPEIVKLQKEETKEIQKALDQYLPTPRD